MIDVFSMVVVDVCVLVMVKDVVFCVFSVVKESEVVLVGIYLIILFWSSVVVFVLVLEMGSIVDNLLMVGVLMGICFIMIFLVLVFVVVGVIKDVDVVVNCVGLFSVICILSVWFLIVFIVKWFLLVGVFRMVMVNLLRISVDGFCVNLFLFVLVVI